MRTPEQFSSIHQDIPDISPAGPPGIPESKERLYAGKHIFVTGGTRDYGESIVNAFLPEGAMVRSCYISDGAFDAGRSLKRRVDEPISQATAIGYDLDYVRADLRTREGLQKIFDVWDRDFNGRVDTLVLNTSGDKRDINVIVANTLVNKMLAMRHEYITQQLKLGKSLDEIDEATIVLMQSVPGRFAPQLRGNPNTSDRYKPIAEVKYEGQESLRKRIPEFTDAKTRFVIMAAPEGPETRNMSLFRRADREIDAKMSAIAAMLGLPETIATADVGPKILTVLSRKDLPQGYVDFLSDTKDARSEGLKRFYGESAIYVDTIQRVDKDHGVGRMIVTPSQTDEYRAIGPTFEGKALEVDERHIIEEIQTEEGHARDHFKDGMLKVIPGHNSIRFAVEALDVMHAELRDEITSMHLTGFERAQFLKAILPGEKITVEFTLDDNATIEAPRGTAIVRKADGKVATIIEGLQCQRPPEGFYAYPNGVIFENQIIESWAQTIGLTGAEAEDVPMLESIGKTEFYQEVFEGEAIANVAVISERPKQGFRGNVYCWSGENVVGVSKDIKVRTITQKQADRIFGKK